MESLKIPTLFANTINSFVLLLPALHMCIVLYFLLFKIQKVLHGYCNIQISFICAINKNVCVYIYFINLTYVIKIQVSHNFCDRFPITNETNDFFINSLLRLPLTTHTGVRIYNTSFMWNFIRTTRDSNKKVDMNVLQFRNKTI